jgi:hypothetical protein
MDEDKNKGASPSTVKGITLVNTPINANTPLSSIPLNFLYSYQLIKLDDVVVVVGEYYYNISKGGIKKRSTKRKRSKYPPSKESSDKEIYGNGPDPQVNGLDNDSSPIVFTRENSILVCELNATLDLYKEKVEKLEEKLKFERDNLEDEFKKRDIETKKIHMKQLETMKRECSQGMEIKKYEHQGDLYHSE